MMFVFSLFLIFSAQTFAQDMHQNSRPKINVEILGSNRKPDFLKKMTNKASSSWVEGPEVLIGYSATLHMWSSDYSGYIDNPQLIGSSAFTITSTSCNPGVGSCNTYIRFMPTTEGVFSTVFNQTWHPCANTDVGEGCVPVILSQPLYGVGMNFQEAPECPATSTGSIINVDNRTLREKVSVTGTDFELFYS